LITIIVTDMSDNCNGAIITPLPELTPFTWWMQNIAKRPPTYGSSRSAWAAGPLLGGYSVYIHHRHLSACHLKSWYSFYHLTNGRRPAYLSSYFTRVADVPSQLRLRSSHSDQVIVPSFNLATVGRRAFPVFAANLWNSLPAHLTSSPSLTIFRQRLETFLFRRSYPDLIIWHLIVDLTVTLLFRPH